MTQQIRSSVFETNSSSSHSLTMGAGQLVAAPFSPEVLRDGEIPVRAMEYGWEWHRYYTPAEKLNYLVTQVTDGKISESTDELRENNPFFAQLFDVVKEHTGCSLRAEPSSGYIDHQSARVERAVGMDLFDDSAKLRAFLFDDTSCIQTGNDNNPPPWKISSDKGPRLFYQEYLTSVHSGIPPGFLGRKLTYVRDGHLRGIKTGAGGWLSLDRRVPAPSLWERLLQDGVVTSATILEYSHSPTPLECEKGAAAAKVVELQESEALSFKLTPSFQADYRHEVASGFHDELEFVVHVPASLATELDSLDPKGYRAALTAEGLRELVYWEKAAKTAGSKNTWQKKQAAAARAALNKLGVSEKIIKAHLQAAHAKVLSLAVKKEFFDQIAAGTKVEEFRLANNYWARRLVGKPFDKLVVTLGYPSADDSTRRLEFAWDGFERRMQQHPFFGPEPVEVFALSLAKPLAPLPGVND